MPDKKARLFVKSYFAASIEEAMRKAHAELGPEALLLNTREAPPEAGQEGAYEVVFGCRPAPASTPENSPGSVDDLRKGMEELREMMARLSPVRKSPTEGTVSGALLNAGMDAALAADIESAVHDRLRKQSVLQMGRLKQAGWDAAAVQRETAAELERRIEIAPEAGRVTALVGPAGAGKTTCLVKLAIAQGLAKGRQVRLISTDSFRIGGAAQLQTYAQVLGVPFLLAETVKTLRNAIETAPREALILIDTPGCLAAADGGAELANFLRRRQDIDTHLVLTASTRLQDLRRITARFEAFRPAKLLFSRLDEIESSAAIFCEAARTGKPLSFFSTGQAVPEDFEPASKERVTRLLAPELPKACEAVA